MLELIVTPALPEGWEVTDAEGRLPASRYDSVEEAQQEASEYLGMHGGGTLVVRQGGSVLSTSEVKAAQSAA